MYYFIEGKAEYILEDSVVIATEGGVGYEISMPKNDLSHINKDDDGVRIFTYFQASENGVGLYGFLTEDERKLFLMLISVNGVGPKAGLSILSVMNETDLKYAILSNDAKSISKAPGIGAKTAQRIILELKDKIDPEFMTEGADEEGSATLSAMDSNEKNDAYLALMALGYSSTEALRAVRKVQGADEMGTNELVKAALKNLA